MSERKSGEERLEAMIDCHCAAWLSESAAPRAKEMFDAIASDLDALAAAREAATKLRSTVSVMRYEWGQNEHTRALEALLAALDGKREGM